MPGHHDIITMNPSYYMTTSEWSGLDSTAKQDCAEKALATIERWQQWKKERAELRAVKEMSVKESHARTVNESEMLKREIKAGVYESGLMLLVEALHIHPEELHQFCNVRLKALNTWASERWKMEPNEAAYALRQALPLYKPAKDESDNQSKSS